MKQFGTVLVFKEGVTKDEIQTALGKLSPMLDKCWLPENPGLARAGITVGYRLHEFDPQRGGPVWYIP